MATMHACHDVSWSRVVHVALVPPLPRRSLAKEITLRCMPVRHRIMHWRPLPLSPELDTNSFSRTCKTPSRYEPWLTKLQLHSVALTF